jgi:hypothetical protein
VVETEEPAYENDQIIEAARQVDLILKQFDTIVLEQKFDIQWNNTSNGTFEDKANVVLFSAESRKTIGCVIKQFIWQNLLMIVGVVTIVMWLFTTVRSFLRSRELQRFSR